MIQKYLAYDPEKSTLTVVYIKDKKQFKLDLTKNPISIEKLRYWNFIEIDNLGNKTSCQWVSLYQLAKEGKITT